MLYHACRHANISPLYAKKVTIVRALIPHNTAVCESEDGRSF